MQRTSRGLALIFCEFSNTSTIARLITLGTIRELEGRGSGLWYGDHFAHVGVYPIGIDPEKFSRELAKPEVRALSASLRNAYGDTCIIVGVDRLDYIKGLPRKIHALDQFLSENPEWVGKVTLVQVAVPSRENITEYQELANTLNKLADCINLKYGRRKLFVPYTHSH
jgi:trehalose 6-phosphate synthase/phosphatase